MAQAPRDQNRITTLLAVSSLDLTTPLPLEVNPVTHALLIDGASVFPALDTRYLQRSNNLSDVLNAGTARSSLGLVAGGAGDIWVEKAGDTMTGPLLIEGTAYGLLTVQSNSLVDDTFLAVNTTRSGQNGYFSFTDQGTDIYYLGKTGANTFYLYDVQAGDNRITVDASGNMLLNGAGNGTVSIGVKTMVGRFNTPLTTLGVGKYSAPSTITAVNNYLHLGYSEFGVGTYRLIGFGYIHPDYTYFPAYIGFQETTAIEVSTGDLIFGTREVDADIQPTERLRIKANGDFNIKNVLDHDGTGVGFYGTTPIAKQTGVAVTAAGVHAALVNLGLIT